MILNFNSADTSFTYTMDRNTGIQCLSSQDFVKCLLNGGCCNIDVPHERTIIRALWLRADSKEFRILADKIHAALD